MFILSKFSILGLSSRHRSESTNCLISITYAKYNRGLNLDPYQILVNFETLLSVLSVKFPVVKHRSAKCDSSKLFKFIEKFVGVSLSSILLCFKSFTFKLKTNQYKANVETFRCFDMFQYGRKRSVE